MKQLKVLFKFKIFLLLNFLVCFPSVSDNHNIYDTLELIKKDLKTLEKAVYSNSSEFSNTNSVSSIVDSNSEDVLTRHLLNELFLGLCGNYLKSFDHS